MKRRGKHPGRHRPEYDNAIHDVLHNLRDRSAAAIARDTWVSPSTINNWRKGYENGGTRYPQHTTLSAVARVAGLEFKLIRSNTLPFKTNGRGK
jgi:transposase-like protein